MKSKKTGFVLICYLLLHHFFIQPLHAQALKQNGICYVAWGGGDYASSDADQSLENLAATGANWIRLRVQLIQNTISDTIIYQKPDGPTDDDLIHVIDQAHALNMNVMLASNVDLDVDPTHWRGDIGTQFTTEKEWMAWFHNYQNYIWQYAEFAADHGVDQFLVGLELMGTIHREENWRAVVEGVRDRFEGPISYSAMHETIQNITWWDSLDYIGVSAYYQLTEKNDPTVEDINAAWISHINKLSDLHQTWDKQVLITEVGYCSIDGYNTTPWLTEGESDLAEQADCFQAFFESVYTQPWIEGAYFWIWLPDLFHGGPCSLEHEFHDKPAEDVLRSWYGALPRDTSDYILTDSSYVYEIYMDALSLGWYDWSWNAAVNPVSTEQTYSGNAAIRVTLDSWGALSLHSETPIQTGYMDWLEFFIQSNQEQEPQLRITVNDRQDNMLRIRPLTGECRYIEKGTIEQGIWKRVRIPLSHLDANTSYITRLSIQECASQPSTSFFIDQLRILGYRSQPPYFISPDSVTVNEDSLFIYTARAIDPEDSSLFYSFTSYPNWLTPADSSISGVPPVGTGIAVFIVEVTDKETTVSLPVYIHVIPASGLVQPDNESILPLRYELQRSYPNPFNPSTTIRFNLPKSTEVTLTIYSLLGERIQTLISEGMSAGEHQVIWDAGNLPSGIYYYRLEAGNYRETRKMVVMK